MTKSKHTKKMLFASILSMVLCCAMLVGNTFAWFTDSVTSGKNKIVAGNLNVELYHTNAGVAKEEKVDKGTKLFTTGIEGTEVKWEPGVIVYENFKVKNEGDLALKYIFNLLIYGKNATSAGNSLDKIIKVAITKEPINESADVEKITDYTSLEDVVKAVDKMGTLSKGADVQFGVVLYWESGADNNLYNVSSGDQTDDGTDSLWIELGVDLRATQAEGEADSFDENYDKGLKMPDPINVTSEKLMDNISLTTVDSQGFYKIGTSTASIDIPEGNINPTAINKLLFNVTTTDFTIGSLDLDVKLTGKNTDDEIKFEATAGDKKYRVNLNVGALRQDVKAYHDGKALTEGGDWDNEGYTYNIDSGMLTMYVSHLSPFKVTWYVPAKPMTDEEAFEAAGYVGVDSNNFTSSYFNNGSTDKKVYLKGNITVTSTSGMNIRNSADSVIDLNGKTLTINTNKQSFDALSVHNGDVIIRNGTFKVQHLYGEGSAAIRIYGSSKPNLTLENVTIDISEADNMSFAVASSVNCKDMNVTLRNCTIKTPNNKLNGTNPRAFAAFIAGGNFNFENCNVMGSVMVSGGNLNVDGGTYTANGYKSQEKVFHIADTATFMQGHRDPTKSITFGDSILILDNRGGAQEVGEVTVQNATFNTKVSFKNDSSGNLYAFKYVDTMRGNDKDRAKNNKYVDKLENGNDPVMFIDEDGNTLIFDENGDLVDSPAEPTDPAPTD